ncbi:hypothetical protein FGRMN_8432 [Fusarium graminum]|nr:hypothetical protein FGRMN_8432 [Fusarium graminum]
MLRARFPTSHHFTLSIFGCQYHAQTPDATKSQLIDTFDSLISDVAIRVELLEQNDIPSKIWMTYWKSPQSFKQWWESFWRETFNLPATRAMYEGTGRDPAGFGHCGRLVPLTEKTGYWGAYRSRITPGFEGDTFSSPIPEFPNRQPSSDIIRLGKVKITDFPDNLCIVIEGQDYSAIEERELEHWNGNFDGLTKRWITNVATAGPEKGMVCARACHSFAGEKKLGVANGTATVNDKLLSDADGIFPGLDYAQQTQILIWQDISKMEHMGRYDKTHVELRRRFMSHYGPGGVMEGGDLMLWVDLGILKNDEIDAEYVGCYEGTGFLKLGKSQFFKAESVTTTELPPFFNEPRASQPIEW